MYLSLVANEANSSKSTCRYLQHLIRVNDGFVALMAIADRNIILAAAVRALLETKTVAAR
ncbi:MAG: hypothetical protein ACQEV6_01680 [Pseudomonadota bacterium]